MARKYRKYNEEDLAKGILIVIIFFALSLFGLWKTDRNGFWLWVVLGVMFIAVVGIVYILWADFQSKWKDKKINDLINSIRQAGAEEEVGNFISSFGYQKKSEKNVWREGDYSFTWRELEMFSKTLQNKGVRLSMDENLRDIRILLIYYIRRKDYRFMEESISNQKHLFYTLTGTTFEILLCRLYEAMGYSVRKTGKTGDQGCDLVVNMGEQRAVVQAKCYHEPVGNAAVQQAVGALGIYSCSKAYVVTNSTFTPEAIQLAKADNVGLVDGRRLREMLLQYLKENWGDGFKSSLYLSIAIERCP